MMEITITEARIEDAERMYQIEKESFSSPWSLNGIIESVTSPSVKTYIASDENGILCGYVSLMLAADEGEIINIAVDTSYRRRGIALDLLNCALDYARISGAKTVYLEVRESNIGARQLYKSAGFEEIGKRKKYYTSPTEDAILMKITISEQTEENIQ